MSDRLTEILARHNLHKREHEALAKWDAAPKGEKPGRGRGYFVSDECGCGHKWCGTDDEWYPVHFHQGQAYEHALDDIAWLLRQLENERADNALHEDDIHDLRDQVNALWDIVAEQDVPNVLDVYARRLEAQRVMRRGRIAAHGDPMTNYWGGWRAGNVTIEEVTDA